MSLFLSEIPSNIQDTLNKRQDSVINDRAGWINSKTVWARVTSLAEVNNDPDIRKQWILFAGQLNSKNTETGNTENVFITESTTIKSGKEQIYTDGNRPMPGLTSISIGNKGNMGSIREATINYVCWTVDQLSRLEELFMTPGISCLLEWGYNKTIDGDEVSYDLSKSPVLFDRCATKKINANLKLSNGHYDGMQGVITNFSWSLRKDGGFDCTTSIVSMSAMFLDLDIHTTSKGITKKAVDNKVKDGESPETIEENMLATITTVTRQMDKEDLLIDNNLMGWRVKIESDYEEGDFNNIQSDEDVHYFVKWDFLEKILINNNLFFVVEDTNATCGQENQNNNINTTATVNIFGVAASVDGTKPGSLNYTTNSSLNKNSVPKLNSEEVKVNIEDFIVSADPLKCILPFNNVTYSNYAVFGDFSKKNLWNIEKNNLPDGLVSQIENGQFLFKDILINLRFVYDTFKQSNSLHQFLTNLLTGISESCGGYWDFGIMIDEDNPTEIYIVDYKTVNPQPFIPYQFKVYNVHSIITDISMDTEVSEKMKSQIMLGTNRSEKSSSGLQKNSGRSGTSEYNFYGSYIRNLALPKLTLPKADKKYDVDNTDFVEKQWTISDYQKDIVDHIDKVYNTTWIFSSNQADSENIDALKKSINRYVNDVIRPTGDNTPVSKSKEATILPLKLSFSLGGISGIKFGNVISIDYLPERYKTKAYFQITDVKHSIDSNGWKTDIETVMRVNLKEVLLATETSQPSTKFQKQKPNSTINNVNIPVDTIKPTEIFESNSDFNYVPIAPDNLKTINSLHPAIRQQVTQFIQQATQAGYNLRITSGLRTFEEQTILYNQGRTTDGIIVTNAPAGSSLHNYGLAIDIVDRRKGYDIDWEPLGGIGRGTGLEWGGDWVNFTDRPHFQLKPLSVTELRRRYDAGQLKEGYVIL